VRSALEEASPGAASVTRSCRLESACHHIRIVGSVSSTSFRSAIVKRDFCSDFQLKQAAKMPDHLGDDMRKTKNDDNKEEKDIKGKIWLRSQPV
jgi:hypothetical protein